MSARRIISTVAATGALALAGTLAAGPAAADAPTPGHYCAQQDRAGVREQPGGAARDNLRLGQTFQVERVDSIWVYGYKIVNGVHGWVMRESLTPC